MRSSLKIPTWLTLLVLLGACATQNPAPTDAPETAAESIEAASTEVTASANEPDATEVEIEYGNFTEEQLYQAIISELGAQRGEVGEAGENYFDLAMQTKDLAIIRRAAQFATVNNDVNALLQLGLLWTEVDPDDAQPHLMLSFQFLESGNFPQALSHMARVIELGGDMDFSALAARTGQLDVLTRDILIENLGQLTREFPDQQSMRVALVQLLAQNAQYDEALQQFNVLLDVMDMNPNLVLLHAQILQRAGELTEAERVLREGTRNFGEDKTVRLSYARLLIQNGSYSAAREQFSALVEQDPQDWETQFSIAMLDLEMEDYEAAAELLERLTAVDQRADQSRYYLGYIYEQLDDPRQAIQNYREVRIGTQNFLAAQQQATRLSISIGELEDAHDHLMQLSRGQPRLEILFNTVESGALIQAGYMDEAGQLLERALNKYPNDTDLLFARVLLNDSLGNQAGSERDLRQIILMKPEDSQALNHLGYMLADQTDRHQEALELIERAIAISPDDPAIIDSLGWAQYKLGRYEEALENLLRAFEVFPDDEVASHVGEVLWMMGREEEAIAVWQDALETEPDSPIIMEAVERLQVDL